MCEVSMWKIFGNFIVRTKHSFILTGRTPIFHIKLEDIGNNHAKFAGRTLYFCLSLCINLNKLIVLVLLLLSEGLLIVQDFDWQRPVA